MKNVYVGTWVSFTQDNTIKYSQVKYIRSGVGVNATQYYTDAGAINFEQILEVRQSLKTIEEPLLIEITSLKQDVASLKDALEIEKAANAKLTALVESYKMF